MSVSIFSREGGLDGLNSSHVVYKEDVAAASKRPPTDPALWWSCPLAVTSQTNRTDP